MEILILTGKRKSCVLLISILYLNVAQGLPAFRVKKSLDLNSNLTNSKNTQDVFYMHMESSPDKSEHSIRHNSSGTPFNVDSNNIPWNQSSGQNSTNKVTCLLCRSIVSLIQQLVAQEKTKAEIAKKITEFCIEFRIEDKRVCKGIIQMFKEEVLTVFDKVAINEDTICGRIFGKSCGKTNHSNWNVIFPATPKPPVIEPKLPKPGSPVLKILQLSDLHIDFDYEPGTEAVCGEPLCCRRDDGPPKNGTGAGAWGDYRGCDLPTWTFENAMEHIAETHKDIEVIYLTGDIPGHNVWNQTRRDQISYLKYLTKKLLEYFPDVKVLPALGNHESSPVNSFPPPFVKGNNSISWLYEPMAFYWSLWLPAETMSTIRKGGYYSVLLRPGFRVVSLNMNYCNNQNWWLLLNSTDPAGELQWLISVLQGAEDVGEKVHIIGHIPPGLNDCTAEWSSNFYKVVNRYESTITGMFVGHTHTDHFEIFYDEKEKKRPLQVAYISPSVTPFMQLNPGYRIYTVDGYHNKSSFYVLDHETYIFNLSLANLQGRPQWFKEYSAKEAYNLHSLFPRDWHAFTDRLEANRTLFDVFYRYRGKLMSDPSECDDNCYLNMVCDLRTGNSADRECNMTTKYNSDAYLNYNWQNKLC